MADDPDTSKTDHGSASGSVRRKWVAPTVILSASVQADTAVWNGIPDPIDHTASGYITFGS